MQNVAESILANCCQTVDHVTSEEFLKSFIDYLKDKGMQNFIKPTHWCLYVCVCTYVCVEVYLLRGTYVHDCEYVKPGG